MGRERLGAQQAASCLDDALALICSLLFGQFHCASPERMNSLLDIIMIYIIILPRGNEVVRHY